MKYAIVWWSIDAFGDIEVYKTFESKEAAETTAKKWWPSWPNLDDDGYLPRIIKADQITPWMTEDAN